MTTERRADSRFARLRGWRATLAPAMSLSVAAHATALAIAPGFGMRQPDAEPLVLAVRVIEPIATPTVAPLHRAQPVHRHREPVRAAPVAERPRADESMPVAASIPVVHADDVDVPSVPAAPSVALPVTTPVDSVAPIATEKPSAASVTPVTPDKPSNEPTRVAALGDTHLKPAHYNVAYLNNPLPAYPPAARRMRLEGLAVVRALISTEGKVETLKIEKTSGSDLLDDAARRAVKDWRFVPARIGAETVAHWVDIPIQFRLAD